MIFILIINSNSNGLIIIRTKRRKIITIGIETNPAKIAGLLKFN